MARILLQADDEHTVLLDEKAICREHLNDAHSALQLLQRLDWAMRDAERRKFGAHRRKARAAILSVQSAVGRTFD